MEKEHDEMKSASEVLEELLLDKSNKCFHDAQYWFNLYLKNCLPAKVDGHPTVKTLVLHFHGDEFMAEDTDKVKSVIKEPILDYINRLLDEGYMLVSAYPIDLEPDFERFTLVLRFALFA